MGRFKKGKKLVRSDLWERCGGIDSILKKLQKADILNRNTEYSSELWSKLAIDIFNDDTEKNRNWLWQIWRRNRQGLRERVHLDAEAGVGCGYYQNGTEEMSAAEDTEVGDVESQHDTETSERQRHLESEPIYEDIGTHETTTLERQRHLDPEQTHEDEDTDSESVRNTHTAMNVQEGEQDFRQCPKVKKSFFISMANKLWARIRPQKGYSKLRGPWTDHVYDSFKAKNPCCTLSFKYQHIKAPFSRKKNLPYLKLKAVCTFPSCQAKYCFTMQNNPAGVSEVKLLVRQTGEILHKLSEEKARPATNLKRGRIAKALTHGPSQYFYSALRSTPKEQLLAGNMSECLSKKVLKVIRSEMRKKESIHSDVFMEIHLLQTLLKECATKYYKIPGYIQLFGMNPFIVHLYTECGLSILVHHLRSRGPVSLYLDATGGVVSKIPEQPKCVLYYALVLPGKDRDAPSLPVCELLTNDHSVPPITFWLMQFALHVSKYTQIKIHKVETDYSWALIQSVMLAFNKEDISCYLNRAYELCMGQKSWDDMKSYTILHICSAHILKAVRQAICRQTDDEGLRDFVTFAFARLQNASNMTESRIVFRALCALLTTTRNTNLVKESVHVLESVISRCNKDTPEENIQSKGWTMCESEDRRYATTITARSPFSAYFQQIMQEVKEEVAGDKTRSVKEDNPYFCPGIITFLFDTYLAIFPLWSGLLLGDIRKYESHEQDLVTTKQQTKTRDTNCHVENWFGIVKHSILQKEKKLKPGTFIRKMHQTLQARYTEHIIKHKLPQNPLLHRETPVNLDQSKESWMKKEDRFPSTKSKYYSVPLEIPVPKKRRMTQSKKCSSQLPADELLDKEVDMLWKKPSTEIIVAIVRLRPDQELILHHKDFQTLRPHEWLCGEAIELYLAALLKLTGANLYLLNHFTTSVILNGTREQMLWQKLTNVNFEEYDGLISFININKNHWRFVFLHAKSDCIYVLDSQKGTCEEKNSKEAREKFRDFFQMTTIQNGRRDWARKEWYPGNIKHPFQEDGCSCGVFVMLMAKQLVEEFPNIPDRINIMPSTEMMSHYRKQLAKDILLASESREEHCCMCGKTEKEQTEEQSTWIGCASCKRWFHARCLNIDDVPPEEQKWLCNLCC